MTAIRRLRARAPGSRPRLRGLPFLGRLTLEWALAWALSWAVASGPAAQPARAQVAEEHELKAAFLYNFTQFVEWPEDAFPRIDTPFRFCVVGSDAVGEFLAELVAGERIRGRPLEVRRYGRARDARACHTVFLGADQDPRELRWVSGVGEGRVLTVGESAEFLSAGGLLRFRLQRGRIRLQVNDAARQDSRLRISSKLLQLCDVVAAGRLERGD
jgi:hypothetical protein